jgi:hypothetical protein
MDMVVQGWASNLLQALRQSHTHCQKSNDSQANHAVHGGDRAVFNHVREHGAVLVLQA